MVPYPREPFRKTSTAIRAVREPIVLAGRDSLLRAIGRHLGGAMAADEFLRDVLQDAQLDFVPEGRDAFSAFVREEILPRLMPLLRLEQVHDLVRRTIGEEGSLFPPPLKPHGGGTARERGPAVRPRVVVVEPDAMRRVNLSRALVRDGFDVEVVPFAAEVLALDAFHVVVMTLDPEGERVVEELVRRSTRAGLVLYDDPALREAAKRAIDRWPNDRVSLVAPDALASTLCARVRIVTG